MRWEIFASPIFFKLFRSSFLYYICKEMIMNFMSALEKEYDFDAFETYVREKEKVNMDYRKSLAEKSRLPKLPTKTAKKLNLTQIQ